MPQIQLGYGNGSVNFDYDSSRFELLAQDQTTSRRMSDAEIGAAIDNPFEAPLLEELVSADDNVLIVASDATRATGSAQIVNLLVRRLIQGGVDSGDVAIIFATGLHRHVRPDERRQLLTPFIAQRIQLIDHDPHNAGQLLQIGLTKQGQPVEVNRALRDFAKVILTGVVGFHYFAGFTGGRKSICPGLASTGTIEATHMLAFDFERGGRRAGVAAGKLDGNAVHEECERVTALINPAFIINAIVDQRGHPQSVFAGNWRVAHRLACESYLADHSKRIHEKREVVVISCGGSPYDINIIQAHKALDMAAQACVDGGTIVLLAECRDGLGRSDFLKWFESENSSALEARLREKYEVNGQTAWALLSKTERFRVLMITKLADDEVRRMRITPARSLEEALANISSRAKGHIMPRGAAVLPVLD